MSGQPYGPPYAQQGGPVGPPPPGGMQQPYGMRPPGPPPPGMPTAVPAAAPPGSAWGAPPPGAPGMAQGLRPPGPGMQQQAPFPGAGPGMGPQPPRGPGSAMPPMGPPSSGMPRPMAPPAGMQQFPPGGMAGGPLVPPPGQPMQQQQQQQPPGAGFGPPMSGPMSQSGSPQVQQQQQQQQQAAQPPGGLRPGPPMMPGPPGPAAPPGAAYSAVPGQQPRPGPPMVPGMAGPGMVGPGMGAPGMAPPGSFGPGPPGSFAMPGPPGAPGAYLPGPPGAPYPDAFAGQRLVEQFEQLMLSAGPAAVHGDTSSYPRPLGEQRAEAYGAQPLADMGSCSAANLRPTVNAVPNSTALRSRWQLPLGLVVHPMADDLKGTPVPVIPLGPQGIVRCRRCRTYMNPFMEWTDGGRRYKCNVCAMLNEVPVEYFSTLDANGRRRDAEERPELSRGTVEWVAPTEYMVRPPMPPVFFFLIDVSAPAIASGMAATAAATIRACLDELPGDERTLVGFVTFDSTLHFYNLNARLDMPQMLVVGELEEPFLPLPDDLLVNLKESRAVVDALLESLPQNFAAPAAPQGADSATGPALQAAFLAMSHVGGKLLLFQYSPPSLGPGRTKARENPQLYGTDREPSLRNPEDAFFKRFAAEASRSQITLDLFAFSPGYTDLASWSTIPRYTCGQVYYYPGFAAARDGAKLSAELRRNLTRPTAWEAVMRVRTSKGLRISSFHGHFFNRSTDLLALPTCDPDKAFAVQMAHEETMVPGPYAYVQCALLYTNSNTERRIRVHTMALPVVQELSELYRSADAGATACLLGKLGVEKAGQAKLDDTRKALEMKVGMALKEYRLLHSAHARNPGALIFPHSLRHLPLFTLGLIKGAAFRGGAHDVTPDERMAVSHAVMAAPVEELLRSCYPDCYQLHDPASNWGSPAPEQNGKADGAMATGSVVLPPAVPCSLSYIHENGAYLLDNGRLFVLWLGRSLDPGWVVQVLGPDAQSPATDVSQLPVEPSREGSALSSRLCALLGALRRNRSTHAQCFAVWQGSPLEAHVLPFFVEDRSHGQMGYADFMQHLHRMVLNK